MDLTNLVGWGLTVIVIVGGIIARDRYLLLTISTGDASLQKELDRRTDVLHERVNKTRDEFVRREDLDGHLQRIEGAMRGMHEEQKGTNKRIDEFMNAMVKNGS